MPLVQVRGGDEWCLFPLAFVSSVGGGTRRSPITIDRSCSSYAVRCLFGSRLGRSSTTLPPFLSRPPTPGQASGRMGALHCGSIVWRVVGCGVGEGNREWSSWMLPGLEGRRGRITRTSFCGTVPLGHYRSEVRVAPSPPTVRFCPNAANRFEEKLCRT